MAVTSNDATAPSEERVETSPPGTTIYARIELAIDATVPQSGIFIPQGFDAGSLVDIVLYLRGFQYGVVSIRSYFQKDYGRLREGVNASGRNVVLVATALGPQSQAGRLLEAGGLDHFLSQALSAVRGRLPNPPGVLTLNHLILACHSGGGAPTREIAGGRIALSRR
jgi:hypothetical protein